MNKKKRDELLTEIKNAASETFNALLENGTGSIASLR